MARHGSQPISVKRLEKRLDNLYAEKINIDDWSTRSAEDQRVVFLQRSLAAYVLVCLDAADPPSSILAITDGGDDCGLDAIHFDSSSSTVYVVQSKWQSSPAKSIPQADAMKFMRGLGKILHEEWDGFNSTILAKKAELTQAVYDANTKFVAVIASPVDGLLQLHAQQCINESLGEFNGSTEPIVFYEGFDLGRLHRSLYQTIGQSNINFDITLFEWGVVTDPYHAYYGQIEISDVLEWRGHGPSLFSRNLRYFQGHRTDVFASVSETLRREPSHFWYYNNGATMLCDEIKKKPVFGNSREKGVFECRGVNIVNGAQTIGSIWHTSQTGAEVHPKAKLPLRIISLQGCPESFAVDVTRAANTQNKIEARDFAALDPNQQRLAIDMALEGKRYCYRSGDTVPSGAIGCDIYEATIALACAEDLELMVQAKREVGLLWGDITQDPYKKLFSDHLSADKLWRAVSIKRAVDLALRLDTTAKRMFRGPLIAAHGNRFVLYRVFKDPQFCTWADPASDVSQFVDNAAAVTIRELQKLIQYIASHLANAYPQNVFKNLERCREIDRSMPRGNGLNPADPPPGFLLRV